MAAKAERKQPPIYLVTKFSKSVLERARRDGKYYNIENIGNWWNASEQDNLNAYRRTTNNDKQTLRKSGFDKNSLFSVRCIKASQTQANQQKSLEETIGKVITAYNSKNETALNALIPKDFGIAIIQRPGIGDIFTIHSKIPTNQIDYPNKIPTDLKIHIGEFPQIHDFDDCKWDKPAGIYISKTPDRLTEIAESREFLGLEPTSQNELQTLKTIDENSQEILILGKNGELLLAFHLTYLNEKWHLTIIDIAKGDCGG